ncbi:MAG: GNAT family N-acetyltransferase [Magnetococcales bacterium]|nr:GNAT family N-acetyltransferase [Magnetococcales bacterium]MBF0321889.1 GNAT family N-acetyltransferase [Magnetococcales bacterium]
MRDHDDNLYQQKSPIPPAHQEVSSTTFGAVSAWATPPKTTVRLGRMADLIALGHLLHEAHMASRYRDLPMDVGAFKRDCMVAMRSPRQQLWVAERQGEVVGALVAVTSRVYGWSPAKVATDIFFYVTQEGRGSGTTLLRRFLDWAASFPDVVTVVLQTGVGIYDDHRVERLYEAFGMEATGQIYQLWLQDNKKLFGGSTMDSPT